jgi:hypothetical protein
VPAPWPPRPRVRKPAWAKLADEQLLDLRLSDLGLTLEDSGLAPVVQELHDELAGKRIRFRPHVWLSNEWFTPDRVPGIAIPFYLAHPRLMDLERAQMLEVEGGTRDWFLRILRHEAGHAIDNAYRLNRRAGYRKLFGNYFDPYPESYRPRPYSRDFVVHLDMWYAQSHPAEDFAETFAVWLNPASHWRRQYKEWPALAKLRYVDELMLTVCRAAPPVRSRRQPHPLREMKFTLRAHYEQKRAYYNRSRPRFYERDLRRIFSDAAQFARKPAADAFLESIRGDARAMISRWTGESQFTIDRTLADMILAVRRLRLRLAKPPAEARADVMMMLAVQTMNYLNDGKHRVIL